MKKGAGLLVGKTVDEIELKIEENEIFVRGENVINEYTDIQENSKDKWYRTEDMGYIDGKGRLVLLGKVKTMHTAHYFIEYNKYDTIKKEIFDNNYTYGFDKEGKEILFIEYDMHGNISSKYERRYNEKDSLTYLREFIWGENFGTYIEENSYFYNPLGLLQELKGYSLKESDTLFLYRELYKYNDKQQLLESHYYSNDTLIETVIRSYNDRGKLIKELDYSKGKLRSEYKLEYDERGNLIKKDYYFRCVQQILFYFRLCKSVHSTGGIHIRDSCRRTCKRIEFTFDEYDGLIFLQTAGHGKCTA